MSSFGPRSAKTLLELAGVYLGYRATRAAMRAAETLPAHYVSTSGLFGRRIEFTNPWPTWKGDAKFSDVHKFMKQMRGMGVSATGWLEGNKQPTAADWSAAFPLHTPDFAALASPPADAVQAVWVGHASVLVQLEGLTFLTDPVLSERASPVQFVGPKRVVGPAIEAEDPRLPHLDFVVISHNHYDHLDTGSVKRLHKRYGPDLVWYVPLGLKAWFGRLGITNVTELDWWQEVQHPGSKVRLVLTPAQHWSSRLGFDRRATLWGGWAVLGQQRRFFFAGDTGYCPAFSEIGERLGPFDLSAIPIGAYEPRGFMRPQHVDPEEAVAIHQDVRSMRSMGIHCCTFFLTLEAMDEPPKRLLAAAQVAGLPPGAFLTLQHGAMLQTAGGATLNQPLVLGEGGPQAAAGGAAGSKQGSTV